MEPKNIILMTLTISKIIDEDTHQISEITINYNHDNKIYESRFTCTYASMVCKFTLAHIYKVVNQCIINDKFTAINTIKYNKKITFNPEKKVTNLNYRLIYNLLIIYQ